jgi:holo-[acyl-carrier protein] synthase
MPRPFPFALGIGTDICHIPRIQKILTNPKGSAQHFFRKVLNPAETLAYKSWLKVAVELDALKADEKQYSEIPEKVIHAKVWPMARFLSGR